MKTLLFRNFKITRNQKLLIQIDTDQDQIRLCSGLNFLVAPNGYGKTSLLLELSGVVRPSSGEIMFGSGFLDSEKDVFYVSEYLTFPKFLYPEEWVEWSIGKRIEKSDQKELKELIRKFRLEESWKKVLGKLSQGDRRKVTWIAAIYSKKPVILLDEPFDGLDMFSLAIARGILERWKKEGKILLVVAHQLLEVLDLASSVFSIRDQKLIEWKNKDWAKTSLSDFRKDIFDFYQVNE